MKTNNGKSIKSGENDIRPIGTHVVYRQPFNQTSAFP